MIAQAYAGHKAIRHRGMIAQAYAGHRGMIAQAYAGHMIAQAYAGHKAARWAFR